MWSCLSQWDKGLQLYRNTVNVVFEFSYYAVHSVDIFLLPCDLFPLCVFCVHIHVGTYVYACLCVEARGQHWMTSSIAPHLILLHSVSYGIWGWPDWLGCSTSSCDTVSYGIWGSPDWLGCRQWSPGIDLSLTPFCKQGSYRHTSFYTGAGDLNSGLRACVAGTLPTELSPGHRFSIISFIFSSSWDPIHLSRPSSYKNNPN